MDNSRFRYLYFIQVVDAQEKSPKALRGFSKVRMLYNCLNAPFFRAVEGHKTDEQQLQPFPRLYISKNRTLLTEARDNKESTLAILFNVEITPVTDQNASIFHFKADVAIVLPIGECHDFNQPSSDTIGSSEYFPKAWMKLKVLKVMYGVKTKITDAMEKNFFRRAFTTYRLSQVKANDLKKAKDVEIVDGFMKSIMGIEQPDQGVNDEITVDQPTTVRAGIVNDLLSTAKEADLAAGPPTGYFFPTSTRSEIPDKATDVNPAEVGPSTSLQSRKAQPLVIPNHSEEETEWDAFQRERQMQSRSDEYDTAEEDLEEGLEEDKDEDSERTESDYGETGKPMMYRRYLESDETTGSASPPHEYDDDTKQYYLEKSKTLWKKLLTLCEAKNVKLERVQKYMENTSAFPNAEGYFKHVYFVHGDNSVVVQTFRRMTISQRTTELVSLLTLRDLPRMGQIVEVLQEESGEIVGLTMTRYEKTLKQYTHVHSHHRLSAYQKMDLIQQMLRCMQTIHQVGIAHRDLSEVNFMVNERKDTLFEDGTFGAEVHLIDFGKAVFTRPEDMMAWWIERPVIDGEYEGEVLPQTEEELREWCENLPWVKAKPDHGYRHYRSIQTLPRTRSDTSVLPWLVNPIAEDMYSIGTIIWKTFAETEPWHGILDTDLRGLRDTVQDDYRIEKALEREVPGQLSRKLLLFCLKTNPEERKSATEILAWLENPDIREGLINEWKVYAPVSRQKRHAKVLFEFEESSGPQPKRGRRGRGRPRIRPFGPVAESRGRGRPRGRPRSLRARGPRVPTGRPRGRPRGRARVATMFPVSILNP
ncbi:hypothetical protein EC973_004999 [Apophysomyces ossiformis]|uniref:Protein kinase domain-containing protein n=1 Tax=Apophysomyces ossiformis TaxID=679940 RepID=A0A8H7BE61_9FUNG|nr:hypothetical protein EC973_004999 [Apophysomyces ossiformis]